MLSKVCAVNGVLVIGHAANPAENDPYVVMKHLCAPKTAEKTFSIYRPSPFTDGQTILILVIRLYVSLTLRP